MQPWTRANLSNVAAAPGTHSCRTRVVSVGVACVAASRVKDGFVHPTARRLATTLIVRSHSLANWIPSPSVRRHVENAWHHGDGASVRGHREKLVASSEGDPRSVGRPSRPHVVFALTCYFPKAGSVG